MTDREEADAIGDALLQERRDDQRERTLAIEHARARKPRKWTFLGMLCGLIFGQSLGFLFHHRWAAAFGLAIGTLVGRLIDYHVARREYDSQ